MRFGLRARPSICVLQQIRLIPRLQANHNAREWFDDFRLKMHAKAIFDVTVAQWQFKLCEVCLCFCVETRLQSVFFPHKSHKSVLTKPARRFFSRVEWHHHVCRGAVANEDLLCGPCKRTCETGYLFFSLRFAFMVVHAVLLPIAARVSCF